MARKSKKNKKIIICVLFSCVIIGLIDIFIKPTYFLKSIIKIILFLFIPIIITKKRDRKRLRKMFNPKQNNFFKSILLGLSLLILVLFSYFILRQYYDFSVIVPILEKSGINEQNFWLVSLHISLINSFLEEFFFRGYSFLLLKKSMKKIFAHLFSSIIFALYHIPIIYNWFSIPILIASIFILAVLGMLLNLLNEKSENIYNSWMSHMFVNFGINIVGLMLLGIL